MSTVGIVEQAVSMPMYIAETEAKRKKLIQNLVPDNIYIPTLDALDPFHRWVWTSWLNLIKHQALLGENAFEFVYNQTIAVNYSSLASCVSMELS